SLGDERHVPRELDGVAKALFGVEEDARPLQRLALPQPLRKIARTIAESLPLPAPFVLAPAFRESALTEQFDGVIETRFGMERIEVERALIGRKHLGPVLLGGVQGAHRDISQRQTPSRRLACGIDLDRALEEAERSGRLPGKQEIAELKARAEVIRVERE